MVNAVRRDEAGPLRLILRVPVPWVFVLVYLAGGALERARTTLLSAAWSSTPSSMDASRNSRAKARSFRSSASPAFQSLLRVALPPPLQEIALEILSARNILRLGTLIASRPEA